MASGSEHRLGGVLMTDERSASEAVMILWLTAAEESALAEALNRQVIIGAVHISRGDQGVAFDSTSVPVLAAPGGVAAALVESSALSEGTLSVLRRLKTRLKSGEAGTVSTVMGPLSDHLGFYVFATGDEPIGPGWTVDYAGRSYPLKPA